MKVCQKGLHYWEGKHCAECERGRKSTPEYRAKRTARRHGVSTEFLEGMRVAQHNACAICRREFKTAPHVDHCHTRGHVRGLLCKPCNTTLGLMNDDITRLRAAIEYLNQTRRD